MLLLSNDQLYLIMKRLINCKPIFEGNKHVFYMYVFDIYDIPKCY